jgi:vacuolar-type H+-ATPase subunit E/Vma4
MDTLLSKINRIEQEVAERLTQIEADGQAELADLKAAEKDVLEGIRRKAEQKAAAIIHEYEAAARAEVGALKQDESQAVTMVGGQASRNRRQAVQQALKFFRQAYDL